jgi:hypothetical protein
MLRNANRAWVLSSNRVQNQVPRRRVRGISRTQPTRKPGAARARRRSADKPAGAKSAVQASSLWTWAVTQMKKIAVVVRERESEALRMALGLTLMDDKVDVFVLDRRLIGSEEDLMNIELMKEIGIRIISNHRDNPQAEYCTTEEVARQLLDYDHVLPY